MGTETVAAGGVLDRDQARDVLAEFGILNEPRPVARILDRLAGCVRPAAIDRDALFALLLDALRGTHVAAVQLADAIVALVRPVAGVTLTPEEAALAREALRYWVMVRDSQGVTGPAIDRQRALAARLEAGTDG